MDVEEQIIQEYLTECGGFRKLSEKYGISRTTICKLGLIHQGIHNLPLHTQTTSLLNLIQDVLSSSITGLSLIISQPISGRVRTLISSSTG